MLSVAMMGWSVATEATSLHFTYNDNEDDNDNVRKVQVLYGLVLSSLV